MSRSLRSVVVALVVGAGIQRAAGLATAVVQARILGVARLGDLVFGIQLGLILSLLTDAGIVAVAARQAAAEPGRAGVWIRTAIRARCVMSTLLFTAFLGVLPFLDGDPIFFLVAAATVFPSCFDLKGLSEAAGVTGDEVRLEAFASISYLAATVVLWQLGITDLRWYALAVFGSRALYAAGAIGVARRIPVCGERPAVLDLVRSGSLVTVAQASNSFAGMSDVVLLRLLSSPVQVGLFAVAKRLALAAEAPASLLSRAVQPHLDHAAVRGDAAATLRRALTIAAYASLPIAVGGCVLAEPLTVRLFGEEYAGAAPALRWLLAAAVVVAVGSRFGVFLFAMRQTRAFAMPLLLGTAVNLLLTVLLIPKYGAAGSAFGTVVAMTVIVAAGAELLRRRVPLQFFAAMARPVAVAAAVGGAAWAIPESVDPLLRVLAGALVFGAVMWSFEGRAWRTLGSGLHAASGLPVAAAAHGATPESAASGADGRPVGRSEVHDAPR